MSGPARFAAGATVRVRQASPPGYVRTPWYLRGRTGEIERLCGCFVNPEEVAYRHRTPRSLQLYRVRFRMSEIWNPPESDADTLDAEIFEHWLEAA